MTWKKMAAIVIPAIALALGTTDVARADYGLVQNGGFEINTGNGQLGFNTTASPWTTTGYNFLYGPGTADTTGATGSFGNLSLWGPGSGSNNGLVDSPDGGFYLAADGAFQVGAISQTISGLTPGEVYTLNFYWAGAQQSGFTGATTEQWQVSLGAETHSTAVVNNADHGFTGWMAETMTFTATGTSEVLSFLAIGTPDGVPPFSLLDGVSLRAVPEPSAVLLMGVGLFAVGAFRMRRRAAAAPAAI